MIHPDTELRLVSPEVGYGVFAVAHIPRGTLTWVLDPLDRIWTPHEEVGLCQDLRALLIRFGYIDGAGNRIVSWDHGRYVNHSCEPNTASGGEDGFEIALRDIQPGEQLTDDYGEFMADEVFECRCGSASCRGLVGADHHVDRSARRALRGAVTGALGVARFAPQPLLRYAIDRARIETLMSSTTQRSADARR